MANWRGTIWRAWRRTSDEELAARLHDLVAEQSIGWAGGMALLCHAAIYGAALGFTIGVGLQAANLPSFGALQSWTTWPSMPWLAGGAGSGALLAALALLVTRPLRRTAWLDAMAPPVAPDHFWDGIAEVCGAIGKFLHDDDSGWFAIVVLVLVPLATVLLVMGGQVPGGLVGAGLALLLALRGTIPGLRLSSWLAAGGLLAAVSMSGPGPTGEFGAFVSAVAAIACGGAVMFAVASLVTLESRGCGQAWAYRRMLAWPAPLPSETVAAARDALADGVADEHAWGPLFDAVDRLRPDDRRPSAWIDKLSASDWRERLVARCALVVLGGEAMDDLSSRAGAEGDVVVEVMQAIGERTALELRHRAADCRCSHCLMRYERLSARIPGGRVRYYGCRNCHRSRRPHYCPNGAVMLLDERRPLAKAVADGQLVVEWHGLGQVWDFDCVTVRQAGEKELQRFVQAIENDSDRQRRKRYPKLPCTIDPQLDLSPQSRVMLSQYLGVRRPGVES